MLIARQKQAENIAEYMLYMYQIEDVIRAFNFDVEKIIESYARPQLSDESFVPQYREWYQDLVDQMVEEKIQKVGHLNQLREILVELSYLHTTLLNTTKDVKYIEVVERAAPLIAEFQEKSNLKHMNQLEVSLNAMYMKLLLKLQKKEISAETEEAFDAMRMLLAYLSNAYTKMKSGNLDFLKN
jgi:hypothetical protein